MFKPKLNLAAAALALAFAGSAAPALAASPAPISGAYVGAGNPSAESHFGAWRQARVPLVIDYLDQHTWTDLTQADWLLGRWQRYVAGGGQLVLSVPMLVEQGGTLLEGAQGAFDGNFRTLAQRMVAHGEGRTIIRLGWEFNGSWFPWAIQPNSATSGPAEFAAYWRRIVTVMRSVPGAHFKFDWTVNPGSSSVPAAAAWPGSAYVDFVGVDAYDMGWAADSSPIANPAVRWRQIRSQQYGLDWWAAFARAHGKPLSVPEWGLYRTSGHGGGDDPQFITDMYHWMVQNHPAYEAYFNADSSVLTGGRYPAAAAVYRRLWAAPPARAIGARKSSRTRHHRAARRHATRRHHSRRRPGS